MWGISGPFWYRGYFDVNVDTWGARATQTEVESTLKHFEASQVIIGHSHVEKPGNRAEAAAVQRA